MNWPSASLGEVCAIISGATPRTEDARFWGGSIFWATPKDLSDIDVLRISDIIDGQITGLGLKKTTKEIASKFKRTELVGNEIVISIRGTVGRCAIVPKMLAGSNVSREIAVIPTIEKKLNPFYLTLMRTDAAQRRLARDIKGVAQSGINLEDLRELPIIQPDNAVVDKFLTAQERFSRLEAAARISFNSMNFAFSSLQHRAFSGQL